MRPPRSPSPAARLAPAALPGLAPAACAKDLVCKIKRPGEPDTTMAKGSYIAAEQAARWAVVQIDIVRVREHDLDPAQRVVGARPLPELFAAAGCRLEFSRQTVAPLVGLVQQTLAAMPEV